VIFSFSLNHILILIILILFLSTYFLIVFVISLRLLNIYRDNRQKEFLEKWESTIFEYSTSEMKPSDVVNQIPRKKFKYLIECLRPYLISLKGDDFKKFSTLVSKTSLLDYLFAQLNSIRKSKVISAAYYLGIAEVQGIEDLLVRKIMGKDESIFISCSMTLARINAISAVGVIFRQAKNFKGLSLDTLILIFSEFKPYVCKFLMEILEMEKSNLYKIVIISVFRNFKYYDGGNAVLNTLYFSTNQALTIACIKYLKEIENIDALPAFKRMLNNSKPEIRAETINAIAKVDISSLEDKIFLKIFDTDYYVQLNAAWAILNNCPDGEERLIKIADDPAKGRSSEIAQMVLSERKLRMR
jgi:hypothetical protein